MPKMPTAGSGVGPNWRLNDDYRTVTVTFPTNPPVALQLSLAEVEAMLKNLGMFRGAMKPPVASEFPMGQKVEALRDPKWVTEPDLLQGHSLVHIRDERYGWLHYLLPPEEAKKLGQFLLNQADAQPTTETAPNKSN